MFCKKGILRNFVKFTGKHLSQSLFFNKVAGCLRPATLLKKRIWYRYFHVNFVKFLRIPFLTEHPRWLLPCDFETRYNSICAKPAFNKFGQQLPHSTSYNIITIGSHDFLKIIYASVSLREKTSSTQTVFYGNLP